MYWIVSVPFEDTLIKKFTSLKAGLGKLCEVERFKLPSLKSGTLDALMKLSDEIIKHDRNLEAITSKFWKTLKTIDDVTKKAEIQMDDDKKSSIPNFLNNFEWNEGQFMVNKGIKALVEGMVKQSLKLEEELRVKFGDYQTLKSNVLSLERKQTGTLLVKSLDGIIQKEHVIDTEYLKTIFVVTNKNRLDEWNNKYPNMGNIEHIVPDSSIVIFKDNEYVLVNCVVLKKIAGDFKAACIKEKFVVRDFEFNDERFNLSKQETKSLIEKQENLKKELTLWCRSGFSEMFSSWIHLKALRTYVESVLRYGLPPNFVSVILKLQTSNKRRIHNYLKTQIPDITDEEKLISTENTGNEANDFYSCVLIEINPKTWE